jgi:cardiolipin synthase
VRQRSQATTQPHRQRGRFWGLLIFSVLFVLALAAGVWLARLNTPSTPAAVATPLSSRPSVVTGVFVQPGDGRAPILDELEAAAHSIDLEIYIVTDNAILQALEDAAHRGITVRVILEQHPFGGDGRQQEVFDRLTRSGIAVRWSNPVFTFTHIKTFVIDNAIALIMNQNLSVSSFTQNREFGIVTTHPDAVRTAAAIFEADWTRGPEPDPAPLVVSPTNARSQLLGLIRGATSSLDIYAEVLADREVLGALGEAAQRGVRVRLIVTPTSDNAAARAALAADGVEVRLAKALYVHAKLIVADGKQAFVGSQNFSATSLDQNRELGIVVDDPVALARLNRTFNLDFAASEAQANS